MYGMSIFKWKNRPAQSDPASNTNDQWMDGGLHLICGIDLLQSLETTRGSQFTKCINHLRLDLSALDCVHSLGSPRLDFLCLMGHSVIPSSQSPLCIPTSLPMCVSVQDQRELERPCILQISGSSRPLAGISKPAIMFRISGHIFFKSKKPHEPIFLKNMTDPKNKITQTPPLTGSPPLSLEDKLDLWSRMATFQPTTDLCWHSCRVPQLLLRVLESSTRCVSTKKNKVKEKGR